MASLPVLQADELEVTLFPAPIKPPILALVPLFITCSTIRLPSRLTRRSLTMGTTLCAIVSIPPIPEPAITPVSQSTVSSLLSGMLKPASIQASTADTDA